MRDFQYVSKEELIKFVQSYPYPLERDLYMDWYSWNDFRDGRVWPESVVAMASVYDDEFKICKDYLASKADRTEASSWISVKERLPEKDESILLYFAWRGLSGTVYKEIALISLSEAQRSNYRPIAWMPLPQPPKEEADDVRSDS